MVEFELSWFHGYTQRTVYRRTMDLINTNATESAVASEFVRPDLPSRCTWNPNSNSVASPHNKQIP